MTRTTHRGIAPAGHTFLDRPVTGDFTTLGERPAQRPASELEPLLQAVFTDQRIHCVGWFQTIPYHGDDNSGTFRANNLWFRTTTEDPAEDPLDLAFYRWHSLSIRGPVVDDLAALDRALQSGEFDDALLEAFGIWAWVTANRQQFTIAWSDYNDGI